MASCKSPTLHRRILSRIVLFVALAALCCGLWICFPLVVGDFTHSNYQIAMELPAAMQTQQGYWYCIAYQVGTVALSSCLVVTFDCCFFTWLNAVSFHLSAILTKVEAIDTRPIAAPKVEDASQAPIPGDKELWVLDPVEEGDSAHDSISYLQDHRNHMQKEKQNHREQLFTGKAPGKLGRAPDAAEPVEALTTIDSHYSQVMDLCTAINRMCGLPVLVMHAATMTVVLFGLYASIMLASELSKPGRSTQLLGFVVYISIFVLRIILVSFDGGQITEQCQELSAALASMEWLHLPQEARLRRKILRQKTAQPLCISAAGVFNVNKINVLNIFSFVLTYLVVMIQ